MNKRDFRVILSLPSSKATRKDSKRTGHTLTPHSKATCRSDRIPTAMTYGDSRHTGWWEFCAHGTHKSWHGRACRATEIRGLGVYRGGAGNHGPPLCLSSQPGTQGHRAWQQQGGLFPRIITNTVPGRAFRESGGGEESPLVRGAKALPS